MIALTIDVFFSEAIIDQVESFIIIQAFNYILKLEVAVDEPQIV